MNKHSKTAIFTARQRQLVKETIMAFFLENAQKHLSDNGMLEVSNLLGEMTTELAQEIEKNLLLDTAHCQVREELDKETRGEHFIGLV